MSETNHTSIFDYLESHQSLKYDNFNNFFGIPVKIKARNDPDKLLKLSKTDNFDK